MDDKSLQAAHYGASPGNGSIANVSSSSSNSGAGGGATAGGGGSINQLGNSNGSNGSLPSASGQRTSGAKKHNFKPETYEACIQVGFITISYIYVYILIFATPSMQYIGDGAGAMPVFPAIELSHSFHSELTLEDVDTFRALYREHCESFLDAVLNLEFGTVEFLLRDFWRTSDNNNLDECEEEKYLSKSKLYLLCHCAEVQKFVREVSTVPDGSMYTFGSWAGQLVWKYDW